MPRLRIYDEALCLYKNEDVVLEEVSEDDVFDYALGYARWWSEVKYEDEKENFEPSKLYPTFETYLEYDVKEREADPVGWLAEHEFAVVIEKPRSKRKLNRNVDVAAKALNSMSYVELRMISKYADIVKEGVDVLIRIINQQNTSYRHAIHFLDECEVKIDKEAEDIQMTLNAIVEDLTDVRKKIHLLDDSIKKGIMHYSDYHKE